MKPLKGENLEAENLARWLRWNNYTHSHLANESGLPPKVAMLASIRKKRMGVTKGVPDYLIILRRGSLLFIELKRPCPLLKSGKLGKSPSVVSEEQKDWIEKLSRIDNVEACLAYGCKQAIEIIEHLEKK